VPVIAPPTEISGPKIFPEKLKFSENFGNFDF
jgi:hypothetical protein